MKKSYCVGLGVAGQTSQNALLQMIFYSMHQNRTTTAQEGDGRDQEDEVQEEGEPYHPARRNTRKK